MAVKILKNVQNSMKLSVYRFLGSLNEKKKTRYDVVYLSITR